MTSPPSLTQAAIDLSRLGKYSLAPGCAEVGGTLSRILAQISCSSGFSGSSSIAGNGHNRQGSPGHKQPSQLASAGAANKNNPKPKIGAMRYLRLPAIVVELNIRFIFIGCSGRNNHQSGHFPFITRKTQKNIPSFLTAKANAQIIFTTR